MDTTKNLIRNYDVIGWGVLFIWWGISVLVTSLPVGTVAIGTGVILIGVNLARKLSGVPISRFSTTVGILALVWGVLELVGVLLSLPFELPIFAILLIVLGVIVLWPELTGTKSI
jgi:uncharacterized membrane protein HdeD (DUF308 family)